MPTLTPQDFVNKWKRVTSRKKQTYQEHFVDLCRLVDHRKPNEADPTGKRYAFEMGTAKTSGGQGWARAVFLCIFLAFGFPVFDGDSQPSRLPLTRAVRWLYKR